MRALVTGGAGFIGSAVVQIGLQAGWNIVVLDNFVTGNYHNLPSAGKKLTIINGDIRNRTVVEDALTGVDVVLHLAASVGNVLSLKNPLLDSEVNVLGTLCLLEAMRKVGVKNLVYSSSAAIFGNPHSIPVNEEHPCDPESPYGVSKLASEKHCLCYGRIYGWQVACLRYFNVYGINQRYNAYGNVIPIFTSCAIQNKPLVVFGDGEQTRDFVNVLDIAQANCTVAEGSVTGTFNIGSGVATTINTLIGMIQEATGQAIYVQHVTSRSGEVRYSRADISKAQSSFKYAPKHDLWDGLNQYINWFRNSSD